jgi:hypothetical protein
MICDTDNSYIKSAKSFFEETLKLIPEGARNINIGIKYPEINVRGLALSFQIKKFLTKKNEEITDIDNILSEGKKFFIEKNNEKIEIIEKKETINLKTVPILSVSYYAFDIFIQCLKRDDNKFKISEILDYQNEIFKNTTNNYRIALIIKKQIKKNKETGKEIIEKDEFGSVIITKYFQLVLYNYNPEDPLKYFNFIDNYLLKTQGFLYEETLEINRLFFQELDEINPAYQKDVELEENKEIDIQLVVSDSSSWAGKVKKNITVEPILEVPNSPPRTENKKVIAPSLLELTVFPSLGLTIKEAIEPTMGVVGNDLEKPFSELFSSKKKNKTMVPVLKENKVTPFVLKILTRNEKSEMKETIKEKIPEPDEIKPNFFSLVSKITIDGIFFPVSIIDGKPIVVKKMTEREIKLEKMISDHKMTFNIPTNQDIPKDVLNLLTEINKISTKEILEMEEIKIKDSDDLAKFMKVSVNGKPTFKCHFDEEEGEYFYIFQGKAIYLKDCEIV